MNSKVTMYKFLLFSLFSLILLKTNQAKAFSTHKNQEHPYLFFSKQDVPIIRQRISQEPFLTRWKVFQENADKVLKRSTHGYNSRRGDIGNSRKYLENAGKTSFAYVITGDKKYAKRAIEEAKAMVSGFIPTGEGDSVWYHPQFRDWNKGADLSIAEISYGLAMVYDWCYDALTEAERKMIREALLEKGIRHYLNSFKNKDFWVGNTTSNWAGVVNGGVGLGALAIYHESEDAREAVNYARKYIPEFLHHVFLKDGGGHEGVMYARYGQLFALYFQMASHRLFGLDVELLESFNQEMAGYWDVYMQGPDHRYANFNNIDEHTFQGLWGRDRDGGGPNSDLNALMDNLAGGDQLLLWAADNGAPRFYWDGASPWYFLWRRQEAEPVPSQDKPRLQDAILFREAGHAIFRTPRMWLAFNAGWISDESHNNRDLGSFILVLDQERVINDPGYGDSHVKKHSTIVINGEDQIRGRAGKYLAFGSGESFHYLASDITNAYNQDNVNKIVRHVLMMKQGYVVIMDEISVKGSAEVDWRLQTKEQAEAFDQQNALIHSENHQLYVINVADETTTAIEDWKGKHGNFNAISKKPVNKTSEHLIVTILFPSDKEKETSRTYPQATFKNGKLRVKDGKAIDDLIIFKKEKDRWHLSQVKNESKLNLAGHQERNIIPYRDINNNSIDISKLPPWFLPIENGFGQKN